MEKAEILREIKRTAQANGGVALGYRRFESETGIKKTDWLGKFWARWNDAIAEAGLTVNLLNAAIPTDELLEKYARLAMELGRIPAFSDLRFKAHRDHTFPDDTTYSGRFGPKSELIRQLSEFCRGKVEFGDVVTMSESQSRTTEIEPVQVISTVVQIGYVYLIKHGTRREYKIGRTNNPLRREGEIGIELPEKLQPIHVIKTDDPAGIEAYWHRHFAGKRKEGEWFALTAQDVRAFKEWKRIM